MKLLNGKILATEIKKKIQDTVKTLTRAPKLVVILVGNDPSSEIYTRSKHKQCAEVGFSSELITLPASISEGELIDTIDKLNDDITVDGILLQSPVPPHLDFGKLIENISPLKDADCFHPLNIGKLYHANGTLAPCTPAGIIELLKYYEIEIQGKQAVIIGRSNIVGKPMANLLLKENATVTICHSKTESIAEHTHRADIVIVAAGKPNILTSNMVKPGATIIDVGTNRIADPQSKTGSRLVGDVDAENVKTIAGALSPVPGGVGPMTVAMLLKNTLDLHIMGN